MKVTIEERGYGAKDYIRDRIYNNGLRTGYKVIAITADQIEEIADLRISVTNSGTAYAMIWIKYSNVAWQTGSGKAAGYGYHKPSAAAQYAMQDAGVRLSEHIDGCGDEAISEALQAIGEEIVSTKPGGARVYVVEVFA